MRLRLVSLPLICIIGFTALGIPSLSWSASLVADRVESVLTPQHRTSVVSPFTAFPVEVVDPGVEFIGELSTFVDSPQTYSVSLDIFSDYFTVTTEATNDWPGSVFAIGGTISLFDVQLSDLDFPGGIGAVVFDPALSTPGLTGMLIKEITWTNTSADVRFGSITQQPFTYGFKLTPVPLPVAFWLFASGLLGLSCMVKKQRSKDTLIGSHKNCFLTKTQNKASCST